jgi:hypothetical protein
MALQLVLKLQHLGGQDGKVSGVYDEEGGRRRLGIGELWVTPKKTLSSQVCFLLVPFVLAL